MQHIASAAGVTRGAIYWHFLDKGALFNAMMDSGKFPIEEAMQVLEQREITVTRWLPVKTTDATPPA